VSSKSTNKSQLNSTIQCSIIFFQRPVAIESRWFLSLSVKNRKERTYVSIIGTDGVPEGCQRVAGVNNVWEKSMLDNRCGVLSIDEGTVVQQIYQWPFQNNLSPAVAELFRMGHQGTKRGLTRIKHLYQNFGRHSTSQCSASLGAHPLSKQKHDQWTWKNNVNIAHQAMPSVVHGLRKESQIVTMACGSIFSLSLNFIFEGQMDDIYSQCLITDTHACSRHTNPYCFSSEDSKSITDRWKQMNIKAQVLRLHRQYGGVSPSVSTKDMRSVFHKRSLEHAPQDWYTDPIYARSVTLSSIRGPHLALLGVQC